MKGFAQGASRAGLVGGALRRSCRHQGRNLGPVKGPNPASGGPPIKRQGPGAMTGITLIELMVTVAVAVILLGVAVPSFQGVIRTNRIAAQTNELVAALNLARSEAITRGTTMTLCRSDDPDKPIRNDTNPRTGPSCSTAAGTGWQNGWLLFVDEDGDGTLDATEVRLKVGQPRTGTGIQVDGGGDATDTRDGNFDLRVSYLPSGVSRGSLVDAAGVLSVCSPPDKRRRLVISNTGRIRIERPGDAPCP